MRTTHVMAVFGLLAVGTIGCGSSDSEQALRDELAAVEAERDDLASASEVQATRHEAAQRTSDAIGAIWDDPESYGGEDGVAAALADLLSPGAIMQDEVFGSIAYTQGFINTLFGGNIDPDLEGEIDGYGSWMSEDGSLGVSMWVWHGTNAERNPFELVGLSVTSYDDDGKLLREIDSYPYPGKYVVNALFGTGTAVTADVDPGDETGS